MSNFKSGSGNLDFGSDDETEDSGSGPQEAQSEPATEEVEDSAPQDQTTGQNASKPEKQDETGGTTESKDNEPASDQADTETTRSEYPYFVRRNNVGDERETRLEIHVRDRVAEQEASFRNDVAEHLDVSEISKTDAREFALLAAFEHPEEVAKLMEEEGFGSIG
jgi:hypothetical protein